MTTPKPRVLCVDDERHILEGLELNLRRSYEVLTASSGAQALVVMREQGPVAVVISDMRMPGMDGATFLAKARLEAPDATRMLLTGHADLASATLAVNEGQIFRFLTKPCATPDLRLAVDAALERHRMVSAERQVLEQTLMGAIKALTDVLSLTSPMVFGRATRIRGLAHELAQRLLGARSHWALDAAAMLGSLGFVTVPESVAEKCFLDETLTPVEHSMLEHAQTVTDTLLANIPRLDDVRAILAASTAGWPSTAAHADEGAILKLARDFDTLETRGVATSDAIGTLRSRAGYDPDALEALTVLRATAPPSDVRELPLRSLREGMVCAEDVRTTAGLLLVSRGFRITPGFLARARNFSGDQVREPIRVVMTQEEKS